MQIKNSLQMLPMWVLFGGAAVLTYLRARRIIMAREKEGPNLALLEELLANAKKVLDHKPSENPDKLQRMLDDMDYSCWWRFDEKTIATKYLNESCGPLHLSWILDHYWGLVTKTTILPSAHLVYDELVKKGHTEENTLMWGDADGHVCYIPCKNKKVFVHTTQNIDFLYVISETGRHGGRDYGRFDIRRIYRDWEEDSWQADEARKDSSVQHWLSHADSLMEHHDDHYRYSRRPSLEAYRKVGFQIPYHPKDREKERDYYGDFRDGGYILSYDFFHAKDHPRVEGSKIVLTELELLATCWLPSIGHDLDIELPQLGGYGRRG